MNARPSIFSPPIDTYRIVFGKDATTRELRRRSIADLIRQGKTCAQIMVEVRATRTAVLAVAKEFGLTLTRGRVTLDKSEDRKAELIKALRSGKSFKKIAKEYRVSYQTLTRLKKEMDAP